jgi:hypothetical protein
VKRTFASLFFVLIAWSLAFAQESPKPERYYVGIGVTLYKVEASTLSFGGTRNGESVRFNNEKGQFTGLIIIGRLLENGPAQKAGLEDSDVLVEVDGEDASSLDATEVMGKITEKSIGQNVSLKVRKTDTEGNTLRELTVDIVLETIDRASWVHLDFPLGGGFGSQGWMVNYSSVVSEDKATGKFTYRYEISNGTPETVILKSTIFNLLFRKDNSDTTQYQLKLGPGGATTVVLESEDFPIEGAPSLTKTFELADSNPEGLKYFKENFSNFAAVSYTDPEGKLWLNSMGTTMHLYVPEKWLVILTEENKRFWEMPLKDR